jgi:hypothetical protein
MRHLVNNPIRRYDFVEKLEWFLVAAVVTILVIRTQLWLTNYPQLGGSGLHIAHLLYGGIFMAVAIWFSLIYLNRSSRNLAAVLGGVGFGFFIDELGKFITEDNDYFFKPAAGIIYLIFIVMFLVIREMSRRQHLDPRTALANAFAFLPLTLTGEFRHSEQEAARQLLAHSDQKDPLVREVGRYFDRVSISSSGPPSRVSAWLSRVHRRIAALTEKPWFGSMVITVVVIWAVFSLLGAAAIEINLGDAEMPGENSALSAVLRTLSILVSVSLVGLGVLRMIRDQHQRAYRAFSLALLVSIFVTRFFSFLDSQFAAVFGLAFDLILYAAIAELASQDSQEKVRFAGLGEAELVSGKNDADGEEAKKGSA